MGTILGRAVIEKAERILVDMDGIRWPHDEMLGWLCGGQRQIVLVRPDACSKVHSIQLSAGTLQTIPVSSSRLLDVRRNMGTSNDLPGRAIRMCEREVLDSQIPDWHSATRASATVIHWVIDERSPKTWFCFPPQPSTGRGYVEVLTSENPTSVTMKDVKGEDGIVGTVDSPISIDDIFENPLIDWIIFRAFSKEATYAGGGGKGADAEARFYRALGVKTESDKRFSGKKNAPPHVNPNVPGNTGALGD